MCDYSFVAILPKNWRRYTVPQGLTVIQWIADFSDRIQQLQQISHVSHSGSAKGLKVIFSLIYYHFCTIVYIVGSPSSYEGIDCLKIA